MSRIKKILIILGVALLFVFVVLLVYNLAFRKKVRPVTPPTGLEEVLFGEEISPQVKQKLVALTGEAVLGAALQNNKIVYLSWDGSINQIEPAGGEPVKIGLVSADRIGEVMFSKDGLIVIGTGLASGGKRFLLFDTSTRRLKALPENAESLAFSPDGTKIVMSLLEKGLHNLVITDSAGVKEQDITTVKIPDLILEWPQEKVLAVKTKPSGLAFGLLYLLDLENKKLQRVLGNIYGLTSLFSPSQAKVLFSKTSPAGLGLELKVLNLPGGTEQNLNLLTLPEKCAWSQDNRTLFCAIMNFDGNFILPDDYYKRTIPPGEEELVKVNLDTGQTQQLISGKFDASNLLLSADESSLFFINKIDGRLYRLAL